MTDPNPETLDRLKRIIRRDLMLGDAAEVPDGLSLIGGEHDLDSLDMLLLVTSIEKEFGVKISNEAMGREAFESLATLAGYIDTRHQPD